ncbi:MAG: hypothetical protein OXU23_07820, partial [Candidatus Poribacteria bacterium]|nr:hypothetical protein [Candidatus Poribacteria bacterium]
MTSNTKSIRLWPLYIVVSLTVLAFGLVWSMDAGQRADKVALTVLVLIITVFLGIVWLLCLSRLAWRVKFLSFGVILLSIVAFATLFRFNGFSGDLVPIFEWRWRGQPESYVALAEAQTPQAAELQTDFPQFLGPDRNAITTSIK